MASGPTIMAAIGMDATNFNAAVSRVTERTNAMAAQMSKAGFSKAGVDAAVAAEKFSGMRGELVKMGMSPAAAAAAMRAQDASAQKAANSTSALGSAMKGMAAYMSLSFIQNQASQILDYGGKITDLSARLGISTTAVQQWGYALKQNGGDVEDMSRFFEQLAKNRREALEGSDSKMASFQHLGISKEMLQTGSLEDIGAKIGKVFEGGANPQNFMAELRDVGGKSAGEMVAMFSQGFAQLAIEAQNFGAVMSESTIGALDTLGDRLDLLKMQFQSAVAPIFVTIAEVAMNAVHSVVTMGVAIKEAGSKWMEILSSRPTELITNPLGILKEMAGAGTDAALKKREEFEGQKEKIEEAAVRKKEAFKMRDFETPDEKKDKALEKKAEAKALREKDKEAAELAKLSRHSVNSLQSGMGGFLGNFRAAAGPETSAANAAIKSEQHLAHLVRAAEQLRAVMSGKNPNTGEDF
jgi:hypothetical protein